MSEHSLARQPILDENNAIFAYEILFRQNKGLNRMIADATEGINERLIRSALGGYSQTDLLGSYNLSSRKIVTINLLNSFKKLIISAFLA